MAFSAAASLFGSRYHSSLGTGNLSLASNSLLTRNPSPGGPLPRFAGTMSGKAVIKAAQMFTTNGQAAKVSVVKEIIIGASLGTVLGLYWQTIHWDEAKKWEVYYKNAELERQKRQSQA